MGWRVCIRAVLALLVAAVSCLMPTPAHADTESTVNLSTSSIRPGESITITASYTLTLTGPHSDSVAVEISPAADAIGTVERNAIPEFTSPPLVGCVWNQLSASCIFAGVQDQTGAITFTASPSADAVGRWNVEAYSISYTPDLVPVRSVGATASFVVDPNAQAPTTLVASTTTLSVGSTEPNSTTPSNAPLPPTNTTPASVGGLPATGPRDALTVVPFGVALIAAGGILIAITRRRPRRA